MADEIIGQARRRMTPEMTMPASVQQSPVREQLQPPETAASGPPPGSAAPTLGEARRVTSGVSSAPTGVPPGQNPGGAPPDQQGTSPEEQHMAERTKENITHWLWGDGFEPTVEKLKEGDPPVQAGKVATETIEQQESVANGVGMTIPQSILLQLGGWTVEELFELMEKAKIYEAPTPQREQLDMATALNVATQEWMKKHGHKVDGSQAEAMAMDLMSGKYDNAFQEDAGPQAGGQAAMEGAGPPTGEQMSGGPGGMPPNVPGGGVNV